MKADHAGAAGWLASALERDHPSYLHRQAERAREAGLPDLADTLDALALDGPVTDRDEHVLAGRAVRPLPDWMPTPDWLTDLSNWKQSADVDRLVRAVRWLLEERENR